MESERRSKKWKESDKERVPYGKSSTWKKYNTDRVQ